MTRACAFGAPHLDVGIIGHRDLGMADLPALRAAADAIFAGIRRGAATGGKARPRCISNAAEGADLLLGQAALRAGFELVCILPKPRDAFARDFSDEVVRAAFRDVLAAAAAVEELDGPLAGPDAYLAAARALLARSHMLVAVWDGRPERGRGGTGQTVREARAAGLPVLIVDTAPPHGVSLADGGRQRSGPAILDGWLRGFPRWRASR